MNYIFFLSKLYSNAYAICLTCSASELIKNIISNVQLKSD